MVIVQVPFRMSFFGGGTDFPAFFNEHGGKVLSTSIDKYCYVNVRKLPPFFEYRNHIVYAKAEQTKTVDEIEHPLIREAMKYLGMRDLVIQYNADLPARSGLGTSSSFAVALLMAFHALQERYVDKKRIAEEAIYLERELCRESGGLQDQIAVTYGGLNRIAFANNSFEVTPLVISTERKEILNRNLMMFFSGLSRFSFMIQVEHEKAIQTKEQQMLEILTLVDRAEKILTDGDLDDFGRLLDHAWMLKREFNHAVTTDTIDSIYSAAKKAGALGGKLLGAGGGGFLVFYVRPEKQNKVRIALKGLKEIPFRFEPNGARILYYVAEDYTASAQKGSTI